jgi:hypothetical protein
MRFVAPSSEDEMIAVFLRGELESERFAPALTEGLRRRGADLDVLSFPNLRDASENELRRELLEETRAYSRRAGLFDGFPHGVQWDRVALRPDELMAVRYINYSYWNELSGGTRRPTDAADRIRAGVQVFGVPSDGFFDAAYAFAAGAEWPELIVVSAVAEGRDVVLEGHVRLTAMALAPDAIPAEVEVIRGVSPAMAEWTEYVI